MLRRLFTFLSAASLLLCVAVCVLWVRSVSFQEDVWYIAPHWMVRTYSGNGRLDVWYVRPGGRSVNPGWQHRTTEYPGGYPVVVFGDRFKFRSADLSATVPYWAAWLVSAVLPVLWAWRSPARRRRRRAAQGQCPACGYDLRATPGRCPESL